jgi:hypothetical protein
VARFGHHQVVSLQFVRHYVNLRVYGILNISGRKISLRAPRSQTRLSCPSPDRCVPLPHLAARSHAIFGNDPAGDDHIKQRQNACLELLSFGGIMRERENCPFEL